MLQCKIKSLIKNTQQIKQGEKRISRDGAYNFYNFEQETQKIPRDAMTQSPLNT